ncbi:Uma2 family endonuclease [Nodosilinea sp. LEGE 07088]|uniref:Uma2 family endonuclease n=1 Tax=Nodosilinea sp. LEGE 07088 TaxID=2777968 RepID=UPI00187EB2E1|nr:Uma2 family endonuclease [Nodosilinea sp. LEGE 07088]MBE9140402.1 Uma2 family endonuclease [Nodosilinea sp. LEGE 07088]
MSELPMVLSLDRVNLTDDQFYRLCEANPTTPLERSASGALVIMSPVGGESGEREADLITDLTLWNRQTKLGKVFSSWTMFKLPGGGDRSPDAAWVELSRWQALTPEERAGFPPICPDFVIELRSKTNALPPLQDKMQEYLASGLRLGWLINPQAQTVEIYRPNLRMEKVPFPAQLLGEAVLPGFTLRWPLA